VEDECSVRDTVVHNLEYLGYKVLQARNGEEGLVASRLHRKTIDLIFTDAVMPRLSGPAMIELLRNEDINIPVLFTTGYADSHGINSEQNVISKPYTTSSLAASIREMLDTSRTGSIKGTSGQLNN
jgi:two-component system cell cycle sensor histidine kinase/response regulator CckA